MEFEAQLNSSAKHTAYLLLVIILCVICQPGFCQEYTAKDSASFQKSLAESHSDAERISYQLQLAEYSARKPGSLKANLDNAGMWISRAKELNKKLKSEAAEGHILLEESFLEQKPGHRLAGIAMLNKAIALLKDSPDKCLLASAYKKLSDYYDPDNPQQKTKKIQLINQSLTCFNQCGNKLQEALTLQDLSETYLAAGNFSLALKALDTSQAMLSALHYKKLQRLYSLFGVYYFVQADYQGCLQYQFKALELCKQMKDSTALYCEINNIIGMSLMDLDQDARAIPYFKTALALSKKNRDMGIVFSICINLSTLFSALNKPGESLRVLDDLTGFLKGTQLDANNKVTFDFSYLAILLRLHQDDKAGRYAKELLNLLSQPGVNKFNTVNSYHILIKYYCTVKDYGKALACLTYNEKFLDQAGVPKLKARNLQLWYMLDSARSDYKSAFFHLVKYKTLNDSLFTEKKSQQIQQLQVKYETQKKEDEIKLLTQNARLDQAELKAAQFTRNATLAGILVFILIAGILYRRYREKQRVNLLVLGKNAELQKLVKEKEWLLKEIHHRVKNNLHAVICLLESQAVYLENDALKAVEDSRRRIYAMSLIHQKLYQSDGIKVVDMHMYLTEFVEYLRESFGSPEHIAIILNAEKIKLGANQAVPVSLIINESVTNAFKYAFPSGKKGKITVELKRVEDEIYLSVIDNGIGFKHEVDEEIKSLGLELMKGLALDLRGTISFDTDTGTQIQIRFKIDDVGVII